MGLQEPYVRQQSTGQPKKKKIMCLLPQESIEGSTKEAKFEKKGKRQGAKSFQSMESI